MGLEDNWFALDEENEETKHRVKVSDVRVVIFSHTKEFPNLIEQTIITFGYCYPYDDAEGGEIKVFNPLWNPPFKVKLYATRELLFKAFTGVKRQALKNAPDMITIHDGILGRDDMYAIQRTK